MSNLEIIQSRLAFQSLSEGLIKGALISRLLDWSADYIVSSLQAIELTTADLYLEIIASPDFKEGSLAITYDRSQLLKMAIAIYTKYNDPKLSELTSSNESIESVELW